MRALIWQILVGSSELTSMIPASRWIQGGAVDSPPSRPFAVYRIVDGFATELKSSQPRVEIWIHDNRGSYERIDRILSAVRARLESTVEVEDSTNRIVSIEWNGDSPDLVDEGYNTNCRNSGFTVTGRK